ncbi:F0F1 ATP synthase subunit gamma [Candidatus Omnitrophota bacterium]
MRQLSKLRKDLHFNQEMGGIINVLKGVAATEFHRLQKARKTLDQFADYLQGFFKMLEVPELSHPYLDQSNSPGALLIITSDSGFLGKLNIAVVDQALSLYTGREKLIVVGQQGSHYLEETGVRFSAMGGISEEIEYKEAQRLANYITQNCLNKKIGQTTIVYPHFVSFAVWQTKIFQLLPCRFLFPQPPEAPGENINREEETIVEPDKQQALEYLVKIWISYLVYGIFWESKLSEWAARVMHLERSSDEIKRTDKKLHWQYFRSLHEISDKNIREIVSARIAAQRGRGRG